MITFNSRMIDANMRYWTRPSKIYIFPKNEIENFAWKTPCILSRSRSIDICQSIDLGYCLFFALITDAVTATGLGGFKWAGIALCLINFDTRSDTRSYRNAQCDTKMHGSAWYIQIQQKNAYPACISCHGHYYTPGSYKLQWFDQFPQTFLSKMTHRNENEIKWILM